MNHNVLEDLYSEKMNLRWLVSTFLFSIYSLSGVASTLPKFGLPILCDMGKDCFIQNYVDHDPGSSYQDFQCGHLTYDGHQGTDFRVKTQAQMLKGVPVLAAAAGKVIGARDGEPDIPVSVRGKENLVGKDAGNGVVIDHGNDWRTQYSHLRSGSVKVQLGQMVAKGQILGMIGESGNADFPHVDFAVRFRDQVIDPFRPSDLGSCSSTLAAEMLWDTPTAKLLRYQPTGVLAFGFSSAIPSRLEVDKGLGPIQIFTDDPALVFWVEVFGVDNGDRSIVEIEKAPGKKFAEAQQIQEGDKAIAIYAVGKKTSQSLLEPGLYRGQFRLIRGDKVIIEQRAQTQVNVR